MRETSGSSNFITHWVRIKLEGFKPERLLNQALARGILLRDIRYQDETEVYLSVTETDYRLLKKLAGSRYKLTVRREGGLRPLAVRIRAAKLTAVGLLLFLFAFGAQTFFVRQIDVIGCQSVTESAVRSCIAEEGLYEGALRRFDCDAIEKKLFATFDQVVWARVAYEGGYVRVEISETRQAAAKDTDRNVPCHIVAEQDCYIEKIHTYRGRAQVAANDFVRVGDVLISGTVPIEHPSYPVEEGAQLEHYVHAEGKVTARVPYYFSFYMEPETGDGADRTVGPEVSAQGDKITAGETGEKAVKKQAETMLRQWIKENVPLTAEILNKDFHFDQKKNIIRVYGTVETRQRIGVEKEIIIDESESESGSRDESGTAEDPAGT